MSSNLLTHESLNRIGGARVFIHLQDDAATPNDVMFEIGAVADAELTISKEGVNQEQRDEGIAHVTQHRVLREEGSITMRLLESINPLVLKYMLDPETDPTRVVAATRSGDVSGAIFTGRDAMMLMDEDIHKLSHPYQVIASRVTNTNVAGVSVGVGTFAIGATSFAVVPVYTSDYIADGGLYSVVDSAADEGGTDGVVMALNEAALLTWTAPVGVLPHHYEIFCEVAAVYDETAANAYVGYADGDATNILITGPLTIDATKDTAVDAGAAGAALGVRSWDGITTYTPGAGNDYILDVVNGTIKRVPVADGGSIVNGQTVVVTYSYSEQLSIEHVIGGGSSRATTFPLTLLQIEKGINGYEEGAEYYFHRVSPTGGPSTFTFKPDTFDNGIAVSFVAMLDPSEGNIGIVRSKTGAFSGITAIEL